MLTVRQATKNDAALITEMSRTTFYDSFAAMNRPEDMDLFLREQFSPEKLMAEWEEPGTVFFLALADDQPAGYARMREGEQRPEFNGQSSIEIARIYADRSFIGKGVGAALMEACIRQGIRAGKEMIWLGVWEKNERAIQFYTRWGFRPFGVHDFILGRDVQTDWLMCRELR